jgi:hypothetical protein
MRDVLTDRSIAEWLEHRMSQLTPLPLGRVRLVGLVVLDRSLTDPDTAARATWIGDGSTVRDLLDDCRDELDRFDAVAAVTWCNGCPLVTVVIVNP